MPAGAGRSAGEDEKGWVAEIRTSEQTSVIVTVASSSNGPVIDSELDDQSTFSAGIRLGGVQESSRDLGHGGNARICLALKY